MKLVFLVASLLCFFLLLVSASPDNGDRTGDQRRSITTGVENLGLWENEISAVASAPAPGSGGGRYLTLVLAAERTNRPDILRSFRRYRGGWDITSRHYWASVGFTGMAALVLAVLWFVSFGLILVIHYCFGWRINLKSETSRLPLRICLVLLILFTCASLIGCILLSVGQSKFHGEVLHTLNYVVNQSDYTVQILRNVTQYLSLAKTINVAEIFLPSEIMDDIDKLDVELNSAANILTNKTSENSVKIKQVLDLVRSALIAVAAVMVVLSLIGLVFSIFGYQQAIHIFIFSGWFLVAVTFILCGVFVILNNAILDTCMAMEEWVENPHAETALSSILPCVDQRTTNQTLRQSKQTINGIVTVVNQFIYTYANTNPQPGTPYSYNQSGPLMPALCYPFDAQLKDNTCGNQEVSAANASIVWQKYTCRVLSRSGNCTSEGRVTPEIYTQLTAAVNESYALQHYTPPLLSLQDCNFVRQTFQEITQGQCPPLSHHLRTLNAGLALVSVGILLCLVLWVLYADRPQREEMLAELSYMIKGRRENGNRGV